MVLIDTNSLLVLVFGIMNIEYGGHKRTSVFQKTDFDNLMTIIDYDLKNVLTTPNNLTEVDNLLNNFNGGHRYTYFQTIRLILSETTEKYYQSVSVIDNPFYLSLGLTDTIILELAKEYEVLITSDSNLSDAALSHGITVYDLIKIRNERP